VCTFLSALVLLKLYIYGYFNRVQSSRRLEREAGRNVEVMWLLGRRPQDDCGLPQDVSSGVKMGKNQRFKIRH